MIAARRREREYFATSPEYKHLTDRMGSEHLGKMLSKVCLRGFLDAFDVLFENSTIFYSLRIYNCHRNDLDFCKKLL